MHVIEDTTGVRPFMKMLFVLIKAAGEGGGWESRPVQRTYSICLVCLQVQTFLSHCPPCYASPSNSNPSVEDLTVWLSGCTQVWVLVCVCDPKYIHVILSVTHTHTLTYIYSNIWMTVKKCTHTQINYRQVV